MIKIIRPLIVTVSASLLISGNPASSLVAEPLTEAEDIAAAQYVYAQNNILSSYGGELGDAQYQGDFLRAEPEKEAMEKGSEHPFDLASSPDSPATIYLDFDGAIISNTAWNKADEELVYSSFTVDDDPEISDAEKFIISEVWRIVSATFAQFDVNVTTIAPSADKIIRSSEDDKEFGAHVIFTEHDLQGMEECDCSGVAQMDSIRAVLDSARAPAPVFVNPDFKPSDADETVETGYSSQPYMASWALAHIAIHEIGHGLGLSHDGFRLGSEYAHSLGALSFYMGSTPNAIKMARWSDGSHFMAQEEEIKGGPRQKDDDLAIIARTFDLRADDHLDTFLEFEAPREVAWVVNREENVRVSGIIETTNDTDVIPIRVSERSILKIVAQPSRGNYQLTLRYRLLDSEGNHIPLENYFDGYLGFDPDVQRIGGWSAEQNGQEMYADLEPGLYFISVYPIAGKLWGPNRFSVYGSVGPWGMTVGSVGIEKAEFERRRDIRSTFLEARYSHSR